MTFMELCEKRQSCRVYADKPVEKEKLLRCVEAARLAPSACNSQPWSFVLVTKPELVEEIARGTQQVGLNPTVPTARAFVVIVEEYAKLTPKLRGVWDTQAYANEDIGGAAVMFCLQAQELGLGTCLLGLFDRHRLHEMLDIPWDKRIPVILSVGYPADDATRTKKRKPMEEIVRVVE